MPGSSHKFVAVLKPSRRIRLYLRAWMLLTAVAGAGIILTLPIHWQYRAVALVSWNACCALDWRQHLLGQCGYSSFRFMANGSIYAAGRDQRRTTVSVRHGSVLLGFAAWLRLRAVDGSKISVLLVRSTNEYEQWRRFRVLWRIGGINIGGQGGN